MTNTEIQLMIKGAGKLLIVITPALVAIVLMINLIRDLDIGYQYIQSVKSISIYMGILSIVVTILLDYIIYHRQEYFGDSNDKNRA